MVCLSNTSVDTLHKGDTDDDDDDDDKLLLSFWKRLSTHRLTSCFISLILASRGQHFLLL